MKKKMILMVLTGFCVGIMMQESISQLRWRSITIGGEIFFIPMVFLLIWFGWVLRDEFFKAGFRRRKNDNSRRK